MIGIYCIRNKINGKCYIGQSSNIERRIKDHFKKPYGNTHFDRAKEKYGKKNFEHCVLIECLNSETAKHMENAFIEVFRKAHGVYNIAAGGQGGDTYFGKTQKELDIIKKKISKKNSANNGNRGQYIGSKNSMYGKKWFTNGKWDVVSTVSPEGFKPGRCGNTKTDIIRDIEILDGGNWTKLKTILRNDSKNVIGWLKFSIGSKELTVTKDHPMMIVNRGRTFADEVKVGDKVFNNENEELIITAIEEIDLDEHSYDVETESDTFDLSGIRSHNCRTRIGTDVFEEGNGTSTKRGNASFTTINLPRLAIEANKDLDKFFKLLDNKVALAHDQLLERYKWQCSARPEEFYYLLKNDMVLGSEKWNEDGNIEEYIKHYSLSIGFIGLAEALTSLTGKHHGESEESQALGLKIVKRMRDYCDVKSEEEKLNWSILATPAEGLSGRFTKIDKKKYGEIEGVTDKEYYTNSFHCPVGFDITAFNKIDLEAPYHALCNAGHITYVELNSEPSSNPEAVMAMIKHAKESGVGYFSINWPLDFCTDCNYQGTIYDKVCPKCGSSRYQSIRRITGYCTGTVDRWNSAKQAELRDRKAHFKSNDLKDEK